jgi:hypothetical protein
MLRQEADLSFTLADWTPEVDPAETTPSGVIDRVLQRLRVVYPVGKTRDELNSDPICGGTVAGIRKALQRLEKRGLIHVMEERKADGKRGSASKVYQAVLSPSRGEVGNTCPTKEKPCDTNESKVGQQPEIQEVVPLKSNVGQPDPEKQACPTFKPSDTKGSGQWDTSGTYPHAREERSQAELDQLMQEAARMWD